MYPTFYLTMHCFLCSVRSGHLVLKEGENAVWLSREELGFVGWFSVDGGVKKLVRKILTTQNMSSFNSKVFDFYAKFSIL